MSRLLDALMQRAKVLREAKPPAPVTVGQIPLDLNELSDVQKTMMPGPPQFMEPGVESGLYKMNSLYPNTPDVGGYAVEPHKHSISLDRTMINDPEQMAHTYAHELGHMMDLGRVHPGSMIGQMPEQDYMARHIKNDPGNAFMVDSNFRTMMSYPSLLDWGNKVMDLGASGGIDFAHAVNKEASQYRDLFARPSFLSTMNSPFTDPGVSQQMRQWYSMPAELTADTMRDYMISPTMFKAGAPETHAYVRDRMSSDPFWSGKIDFKSVVPPVAGAGLAGFDQLEQSNGE